MSPVADLDRSAETQGSCEDQIQHLDEALADAEVSEFEDEIELWTTYGGD